MSRELKEKKSSYEGAQPGPGAAWGGGNPKSNCENGGPEPSTVEQQRDCIIRAYKAANDNARKSFRQWLDDEGGNEVVLRDQPVTREAMRRLPALAEPAIAN